MKEDIKLWLSEILGPAYPWIKDHLLWPIYGTVSQIFNPGSNLFLPYLLAAAAVAFMVYRWQESRSQPPSAGGFWSYLLPRSIYLHRSALLDYKFVFVRAIVDSILFGGLALASGLWIAKPVSAQLNAMFGAVPAAEPTVLAIVVFTIFLTLAVEFGHYLGHYLEHRVPLLWQFHKTHHSCEVLTPISAYRTHPVDELVKMMTLSISTGPVIGVYSYLYPNGISEITVLNVGIVFFLSYLVANLLHSHIWLSYGWRLNHVFMAPCMHQIHHSSEVRHFDRNFANFFSFWDWIFGTIYVPRGKESFKLGISNNEHLEFNSVWALYAVPFKNAYKLLTGAGRRAAAGEQAN